MKKDHKRIVIALGGNAIKLPRQRGTYGEQLASIRAASHHILEFIRQGFNVVITHGNGPQVGNLLVQQEAGGSQVPAQPMHICNAMTQGQMGYLLQQTLMNELKSYNLNFNVVTMITQVLVDRHDPDFQHPSKPVGPFYDPATKEKLESEKGWRMKKVLPGGDTPFRRVVPSPDPIRILEVHALKKVVEAGMIVIASGGGGVPVILNEKGEFEGFEGVVDKDLAGEKLAEAVAADYFMVLTDVPKVKLGFGTPEEREIDRLNVEEARKYLKAGHFLAGSMAPKVLACIRFIEYGGEEAIITSLDRAWPAVQNQEGTHFVP
ncbi:MAG: carbamate kinase [Deltaproteobacteria bacterium RBG_13_51_10]|jgi:carbamate kinase|nr:MAG: carbamate kinase [Deltaproteobacteria bacterium RBG_13_51_10]